MNIMVGYNGSAEAKLALTEAQRYAKAFGARVFVVTSMEGGSGESLDDIHQVEAHLEYAKKYLEAEGLSCEGHQLARGLSPGEDMVRFAKDNGIEHIFVGIEKVSRTRKLLLGSTAQFVILKAPCPVTTVK